VFAFKLIPSLGEGVARQNALPLARQKRARPIEIAPRQSPIELARRRPRRLLVTPRLMNGINDSARKHDADEEKSYD